METYKGYKFTTNKGMNCLVVDDDLGNRYMIIDMDEFKIIASDNYDIIEKLIKTVTEKF